MTAMMPTTEDEEQTNDLADKHDGATVGREHTQATMEYNVTLTESQIDELPENVSAKEFATNLATSRCESELDLTFGVSRSDAVASEDERHIADNDRKFTVFVKVSQNA